MERSYSQLQELTFERSSDAPLGKTQERDSQGVVPQPEQASYSWGLRTDGVVSDAFIRVEWAGARCSFCLIYAKGHQKPKPNLFLLSFLRNATLILNMRIQLYF